MPVRGGRLPLEPRSVRFGRSRVAGRSPPSVGFQLGPSGPPLGVSALSRWGRGATAVGPTPFRRGGGVGPTEQAPAAHCEVKCETCLLELRDAVTGVEVSTWRPLVRCLLRLPRSPSRRGLSGARSLRFSADSFFCSREPALVVLAVRPAITRSRLRAKA